MIPVTPASGITTPRSRIQARLPTSTVVAATSAAMPRPGV